MNIIEKYYQSVLKLNEEVKSDSEKAIKILKRVEMIFVYDKINNLRFEDENIRLPVLEKLLQDKEVITDSIITYTNIIRQIDREKHKLDKILKSVPKEFK